MGLVHNYSVIITKTLGNLCIFLQGVNYHWDFFFIYTKYINFSLDLFIVYNLENIQILVIQMKM